MVCFCFPWMCISATPGFMRRKASKRKRTSLRLFTKTSVFARRCDFRKEKSSSSFCPSSHTTYRCVYVERGEKTHDRLRRHVVFLRRHVHVQRVLEGRRRQLRSERRGDATFFTLSSTVALKRRFWRSEPSASTMCSRLFRNPMSRQRSTSSITRHFTFEQSNAGVCSMCCSRRPGVATRMFIVTIRFCSS